MLIDDTNLNYYTGILYGGSKAIYTKGTTTVRDVYSISTSTDSMTLGGSDVPCEKAILK